MRYPKRSWIRPLLVVAANLLLTFGALEIALRLQEPVFHLMSWRYRDSPNYRYVVVDHPVWDHQLRPNLDHFRLLDRGLGGDPDLSFDMTTNSWGCRYGEIDVPRPSDRFRVIVMGDSFTEGYHEEDSVSSHLERALDERGLPVDFEVMNCGVSSYSALTILLRLRDQLLDADPDAVLINLDLTDPYDDYWRRRSDLRTDPAGRPLSVGPDVGIGSSLRDRVERYSFAIRALTAYSRLTEGLLKHWLEERGGEGAAPVLSTLADRYRMHTDSPDTAEEFEAAWKFFAEQLDRLVELCHEARVACAFSSYPHEAQLAKEGKPPLLHRRFQQRLASHLEARGEVFFDAHDAIAAAYARDPRIYRREDMHFSRQGQREWGTAVADALEPWVLDRARGSRQNDSNRQTGGVL